MFSLHSFPLNRLLICYAHVQHIRWLQTIDIRQRLKINKKKKNKKWEFTNNRMNRKGKPDEIDNIPKFNMFKSWFGLYSIVPSENGQFKHGKIAPVNCHRTAIDQWIYLWACNPLVVWPVMWRAFKIQKCFKLALHNSNNNNKNIAILRIFKVFKLFSKRTKQTKNTIYKREFVAKKRIV